MPLNKLKRRRKRQQDELHSIKFDSSKESETSTSKNILDSPPSMVSFSIPNNPIVPDVIKGNVEPSNCDNEKSSTTAQICTVDTNFNDEVIIAKNNPENIITTCQNSSKIHPDIEQSPGTKQNCSENQEGPSKGKALSDYLPAKRKKMDVCSTPMFQKGVALDWSIGPLSSDEDDKKNDKCNGKNTDKAITSGTGIKIPKASEGVNFPHLAKNNAKSELVKSLFRRKMDNMKNADADFQVLEDWDRPNTSLHDRHNQEHNLTGIFEKENEESSGGVNSQPESAAENMENSPNTCNVPKHDSVKHLRGRDIKLLSFPGRQRKQKLALPIPQESSCKKRPHNEIGVPNCFINLIRVDENTQLSKESEDLTKGTCDPEPTLKDRTITENEHRLDSDNNKKFVILSDQYVNINVSNLLKGRSANVVRGMDKIDRSKSNQEMNRSNQLGSRNAMEQVSRPSQTKNALKSRAKLLQTSKKISKIEEGNYFQDVPKRRNSNLNGTSRRLLFSKNSDIDSFTSPQTSDEKSRRDKADQNRVLETELPSSSDTQTGSHQMKNIVQSTNESISPTKAATKTGNVIAKKKVLKPPRKSITSARSLRSNDPSRASARPRHQPRPFWINECRFHYDCSGGIIDVPKQEKTSGKKRAADPKAGKPKPGRPPKVKKPDTKQTKSSRRQKKLVVEEDRQPSHSIESAVTVVLNVDQYQNQEAPQSDLPIADEAQVPSAEIAKKSKAKTKRAPRKTRRTKDNQAKQSPSNDESATKLNTEQPQNTKVPPSNLPLIEGDNNDPQETPNAEISEEISVGGLIQVAENAMSVVQETQDAAEEVHEIPDIALILDQQQPSTSRANETQQSVMETTSIGLRKTVKIPVLGLTECFSRPVTEADYRSITEKLSQAVCLNTPDMQASFLKFQPFTDKKIGNSQKSDFVFYVMSGRVVVTVHTAKTESSTGEFFYVPRGIRYQIQNRSNSEAVILCVSTKKIPATT